MERGEDGLILFSNLSYLFFGPSATADVTSATGSCSIYTQARTQVESPSSNVHSGWEGMCIPGGA